MTEKTREEKCRAIGQKNANVVLLMGTTTMDPMDKYMYHTM